MYPVFVVSLKGKTIKIEVEENFTVLNLKQSIEKKENISVGEQRIFFCGKQLEDIHSLTYYNVSRDSTLHLLIRLLG